MNYEIKELGLGEILDYTIRLLRDHFMFVMIIVGVFYMPFVFPFALAMEFLTPQAGEVAVGEPVELSDGQLTLALLGMLVFPVTMVVMLVSQGAACYGIAHRIMGRNVSVKDALAHAFSRIFSLVWLSVLSGVLMAIGFGLCILPGVYLMLIWYVIIPVLVFEGLSAFQSLGRSRDLMKGQLLKAFALLFILGIINIGIGVASELIPNFFAAAMLSTVGSVIAIGINAIAVTVFYFSARCANENFDLELLTNSLEGAQPVPVDEL